MHGENWENTNMFPICELRFPLSWPTKDAVDGQWQSAALRKVSTWGTQLDWANMGFNSVCLNKNRNYSKSDLVSSFSEGFYFEVYFRFQNVPLFISGKRKTPCNSNKSFGWKSPLVSFLTETLQVAGHRVSPLWDNSSWDWVPQH